MKHLISSLTKKPTLFFAALDGERTVPISSKRVFIKILLGSMLVSFLPACSSKKEHVVDIVSNLSNTLDIRKNLLGKIAFYSKKQPYDYELAIDRFNKLFGGFDESNYLVRYDELVRNDFDQGAIVNLSGWLMSKTEGSLFSLAYYLENDH